MSSHAAELEKLGKVSRQAALMSALGLTIVVGSLVFASVRLGGAQKELDATQKHLANMQNDVQTIERAKEQKQRELDSVTRQLEAARTESETVGREIVEMEGQLDNVQKASAGNPPAQSARVYRAVADAKHSLAGLEAANQRLRVASAAPLLMAKSAEVAKDKEKEGFEKLAASDYDGAAAAFKASEDAYPGYHGAYELAQLIKSRRADLNDPAKRKEVIQLILAKYASTAPPDAVKKLKDSI